MKPMTGAFNPLIRRIAGRRHVKMVAQIHHRGRTSGREYVTPASARVAADHVIIPLTFGTGSDWCRNILAAGGCEVRYRGRDYIATNPELVERHAAPRWALAAFKRRERFIFRLIGIKHLLILDTAPTP
jgi:deazaflavin-dependent oxidoreductase (nitroreductase family)